LATLPAAGSISNLNVATTLIVSNSGGNSAQFPVHFDTC
jgi:hypothetical protein